MLLPDALDILAERLRTIDGLTVTTDPKVTVVTPMAVITDGELDYNQTFGRGSALTAFEVTVYVSQADSETGLYEARSYLSGHGDRSIRQALETSLTAGDDLPNMVVADTGERRESDNYITAVFQCRVHIPGDF